MPISVKTTSSTRSIKSAPVTWCCANAGAASAATVFTQTRQSAADHASAGTEFGAVLEVKTDDNIGPMLMHCIVSKKIHNELKIIVSVDDRERGVKQVATRETWYPID